MLKHNIQVNLKEKIRVAHVMLGDPNRISGPRNSVTLLASNINKALGDDCHHVFSISGKQKSRFNGVAIHPIRKLSLSNYDLLCLHSIFSPSIMWLAFLATIKQVPYVFVPRGSLMNGALKKSKYKKLLFMAIFQKVLKGAHAVHFLSEDERDGSQKLSNTHFICPNVLVPLAFSSQIKMDPFLLYVGRYDTFHKGLDLLIPAISDAASQLRSRGISVKLHGIGTQEETARLQKLIQSFQVTDLIHLGGALLGLEKQEMMLRAPIFIHTSRYEGQPQAILEAMSCGCAIIATEGTNMKHILVASEAGFVCDASITGIATAIKKSITDLHAAREMGIRGQTYVINNLGGQLIASKYLDILGRLLHDRECLGFRG